jgi:gluconolactonase
MQDLFESLTWDRVASGFGFTEGPLWHPEGYLLFSDIPGDTIYRLQPDGRCTPWRRPSGNSNGLAATRDGRVIACEHGNRRVSVADPDGEATPLATHYRGARLNSPNDVVVRSDGSVYFTDPPYGIQAGEREQPVNGVYRIAPGGELDLVVDDFDRPNGLAFSPDEGLLYIDDTPRRHIRAFRVAPNGTLSGGTVWADMASPESGSPDGLKVDREGHVYSTGPGGIWVFEPDGTLAGIVTGPEQPANLAFGDTDRRTLYITARTSVYALRTRIAGLPA